MKYFALLTVFLTLGVYSCDPFPKCEEVDNLEVFDDLRNLDSIQYFGHRILVIPEAFDSIKPEMKFFINNDSTYQAIKDKAISEGCVDCVFPNIDFSRRTLIGQYFVIGCDESPEQHYVETSDSTYTFYTKHVNNQQCSYMTCPNITFHWLLVPKLESIDQVEFINGRFYYECDC
mgnify:CR=1 FL=1|jgi:hypothetical protein